MLFFIDIIDRQTTVNEKCFLSEFYVYIMLIKLLYLNSKYYLDMKKTVSDCLINDVRLHKVKTTHFTFKAYRILTKPNNRHEIFSPG